MSPEDIAARMSLPLLLKKSVFICVHLWLTFWRAFLRYLLLSPFLIFVF